MYCYCTHNGIQSRKIYRRFCVVIQRGLSFEVKLQTGKPKVIKRLSRSEVDAELEKGYADYLDGRVEALRNVVADIHDDYKISSHNNKASEKKS